MFHSAILSYPTYRSKFLAFGQYRQYSCLYVVKPPYVVTNFLPIGENSMKKITKYLIAGAALALASSVMAESLTFVNNTSVTFYPVVNGKSANAVPITAGKDTSVPYTLIDILCFGSSSSCPITFYTDAGHTKLVGSLSFNDMAGKIVGAPSLNGYSISNQQYGGDGKLVSVSISAS